MIERVKPDGDISPQIECLTHLLMALLALRRARAIAEALPSHGKLYAEIKDACGLIGQSITFLEVERCRHLEIERDLQLEQALARR